ncbi:hypothetical protein AB4455_25315 [Vibrio sp. 10N.261.46.E12]|uniref:hypothetical protein n=1 Tax=unclassified Vibrio TaxID=2614977 RepID=UPI0009762055|nr:MULTISPECIES: hypothetical protein [unclassified Vibrio]OMO32461.1 hypothetical protein BH584_16380 [Vibrio sp. 10N.261.45.E1]PMJ21359.1 hypothetical protein BCU27_18670 [Vibrio sp. 10N.286.45.B6]PML90391.1 hypothetical protein BCT66_26510 [Vibrio sp. 10N.261.49.E11]PMM76265.1 hypothetical protein BCT48_24915 [Vibrio sp. 10N.261.46.F12]PMM78904.1 hypothetical protein BCT46_21925 [Vibrio sp. 10N.261.46.E8]
MKNITKPLIVLSALFLPLLATAAEHNHSHSHFNPALEQLGNDIIGLTVCYKNGYLSDKDQEPAFMNLIKHAGVEGEELGMFYMDKLGPKAEQIMSDEQDRQLWNQEYCADLTETYLDVEQLAQTKAVHHDHSHDHHGHSHGHHHDQGTLSPDVLEQDIERGRLLSIN